MDAELCFIDCQEECCPSLQAETPFIGTLWVDDFYGCLRRHWDHRYVGIHGQHDVANHPFDSVKVHMFERFLLESLLLESLIAAHSCYFTVICCHLFGKKCWPLKQDHRSCGEKQSSNWSTRERSLLPPCSSWLSFFSRSLSPTRCWLSGKIETHVPSKEFSSELRGVIKHVEDQGMGVCTCCAHECVVLGETVCAG